MVLAGGNVKLLEIAIREAAIQICKNLYEKGKSWNEVKEQAVVNIGELKLPGEHELKLAKAVEQIYNELKLPGLLYKAAEETGNAEGEFYYRKILVELWPYFSAEDRGRSLASLANRAARDIKKSREGSHNKKLLLYFWPHIAEKDKESVIENYCMEGLLLALLRVDDKESLVCILRNISELLRKKFIFTGLGHEIAVQLTYENRLESLEFFVSQCLVSEERINEFKKEFMYSWKWERNCSSKMGRILVALARGNKLDIVERLAKWCLCSEVEVNKFKKWLAYKIGKNVCHDLIVCKKGDVKYCEEEEKWELVETFLAWCFSSKEEIEKFKREVILSQGVVENICLTLILREKCGKKWELAEALLRWCAFPKEEEINKFKEQLIYSDSMEMHFHDLIYEYEMESIEKSWEEIELLIKWCLHSKEAVIKLKERFESNKFRPELRGEYRDNLSKLLNELIEYIPSAKGKRKIEEDEDENLPSKKLRVTEASNVTHSRVEVI